MKIFNVNSYQQNPNTSFKARLLVEQSPFLQDTFKKTPKKAESFDKIMLQLAKAVKSDDSIDTIEIKGGLTDMALIDIAPNSTQHYDPYDGIYWERGENMRTAHDMIIAGRTAYHGPNFQPIRRVSENLEIVVRNSKGDEGKCGFFLAANRRTPTAWTEDFLKSIEHAKKQIGNNLNDIA